MMSPNSSTTRLVISGTGTSVGKTCVTRGIARALARDRLTLAIKPIETGCETRAEDADLLGAACFHPELADHPAWYRAPLPLAPAAVTVATSKPPPDLEAIANHIIELEAPVILIEGAGGLLVPLDDRRTIADLARRLDAHVILVAPNRLGVLSDLLAIHEAATRRDVKVAAAVLTATPTSHDLSSRTNRAVLRPRLAVPIFELVLPEPSNDDALANAVADAGILSLFGGSHP